MRAVAQGGENPGELGRQQIAGFHRQQLPDFHYRATHLREFAGESVGVRRVQQHLDPAGLFTLRNLPGTLAERGASHAGRHAPEPEHAVQPTGRQYRLPGLTHDAALPGI